MSNVDSQKDHLDTDDASVTMITGLPVRPVNGGNPLSDRGLSRGTQWEIASSNETTICADRRYAQPRAVSIVLPNGSTVAVYMLLFNDGATCVAQTSKGERIGKVRQLTSKITEQETKIKELEETIKKLNQKK